MDDLGIVVIGRNEGDRLRRCLQSLDPMTYPVVYVDSGSSDGSVALARSLGAVVIELDLSVPFTAARGRNAGFEKLLQIAPQVRYVQFVDGDCEVYPNWLKLAKETLVQNPKVAVVCGRRRERHPEVSVYNRLCDIEWNTPVGEARCCGGDVLARTDAILEVGGYDPTVVAGEDNEVCIRIRKAGWKVLRIDADMTLHDAAMVRIGQWWKRAVRCGYAYALGVAMHGSPPEQHFVRERRRVVIWGAILPLLFLAFAPVSYGLSLLGFLLYPVQMARIARRTRRGGVSSRDAWAFGVSCMLSKFPEFLGLCQYFVRRCRGNTVRIIEYK